MLAFLPTQYASHHNEIWFRYFFFLLFLFIFISIFFLVGISHPIFFSPQLEVVKTRLQLQGELAMSSKRPYKGTLHAFYVISKTEGILAVQKVSLLVVRSRSHVLFAT